VGEAGNSFGLQFTSWLSDNWGIASFANFTVAQRPSMGAEFVVMRRLFGAPPIESGWRLHAVVGLGVLFEDRRRLGEDVIPRPSLGALLRAEGVAKVVVFWADLGVQMSSAWIDMVAVMGIGLRITEDTTAGPIASP
jgi:hypothetical protein